MEALLTKVCVLLGLCVVCVCVCVFVFVCMYMLLLAINSCRRNDGELLPRYSSCESLVA